MVLISIGAYLFCFAQPGFFNSAGAALPRVLLIMGWLGAIVLKFSWYANPAYFIALLTYNTKPIATRTLGAMALVLALSFLAYSGTPTHNGGISPIKEIGLGYYLWVFSFLLLFLASLIKRY